MEGTTLMLKRIGALAVALGLLTLGMGGVASATEPEPLQSYVCKYVGTPGPGERLQTGGNPIYVSNASLGVGAFEEVAVGDSFADAQGRSVVIVANTDKLDPEPAVTECPLTPPEPEVTVDTEDRKSCEAGVESREVTTTTPYVYDYETNEWVPGDPKVTYGDWTFVRDLTHQESDELGCVQPPDKVVVTSVPDERSSCEAGVEQRDQITRTVTPYVFADGEWTLDTGNAVTTERVTDWSFVRDLTAAERAELECDAVIPPPEPPNPAPPAPEPPVTELPHTGGNGSAGLLTLIGSTLIGLGGLLYRKFAL